MGKGRLLAFAATSILANLASPAHARTGAIDPQQTTPQDPAASPPPTDQSANIIVTAVKRSPSVQNTPTIIMPVSGLSFARCCPVWQDNRAQSAGDFRLAPVSGGIAAS